MANGQYTFPGEVEVSNIDLIDRAGKTFNIVDLVQEINLYEDIFSNTMNGYLLIQDAAGLLSNHLIIGEEMVVIKYKTPEIGSEVNKTFYVYKLSDRSFDRNRATSYILHVISREAIESMNKKLSKAYSGKISETVKKLFDEVKTDGGPELDVEDTANDYRFISAYWSPFETINWLSRRAINAGNVPNYLFYEDADGYKFRSVNRMMNLPIKREFVYADINTSSQDGNLADSTKKVNGIYQDVGFDYIRRLSSGMYAGRLATLDMTNKTVNLSHYDYIDNFSQAEHLQPNPLVDTKLIRNKIASLYFIEKNTKRFSESDDQKYDLWYLQNNSFMEQLNAFKFNIEVYGSTTIKAGDTIDFTINGFDQFTEGEKNEIVDKFYSGKYLITAIRHRIRSNEHVMFLEIIKDSLAKQIK